MGRSRSRDKEKKERREKDRDKEKKEKDRDKEKKRSRSRDKEKEEKKEKKEKRSKSKRREEPPPPERKRSPSLQYRRWRFDSPPKEEEYARDAMLTGNPGGLGGLAAALQGGLALGGANALSPLALAADTRAMRELYVGNLPAGITSPQLVQFLNQVAVAVKVNTLPGDPILSATLGGGGLFAFVEFRTAEESANGLRLNGVELLGCQLKIGRPKGYTGDASALPAIAQPGAGLQTGGGMLALGNGQPSGGEAAAAAARQGGAGAAMVSAIDHRLCLVNIPTFVGEERIKELLTTFGQLKFFALQKDEDGKSVGVAFFEYQDMMTQQQARAALEGLELGAKKLSVKKPDEVIKMGLVSKEQKLGARVIPCKVLYLKNVVTADELRDDAGYQEICTDIRLEAEKFGPVTSMEIPRPGQGIGPAGAPQNALTAGSGPLALEDGSADAKKAAAPVVPDLSMAIVVAGSNAKAPVVPQPSAYKAGAGDDVPGIGYAFVEFATIEGASKAKKALNGRRFGSNLVEAEYFSENRYLAKDFAKPTPNTDEPVREAGMELALFGGGGGVLEEAPVMAD
eukprot:TRINITY_DN579_c0_g1_i1.p1 TRINITY_DN579_c0_g1~~TRINITY_DN579_c0_g1_i1.p1  ORF type:complete len:595 (-),score=180.19 TRINITY_DN579_c0_g1_i1:120-1829(-)